MSKKTDIWQFPPLRPAQILGFVTAMAPHLDLAQKMDLRFNHDDRARLSPVLPVPPKSQDPEMLAALRGHLATAYEIAGRGQTDLRATPPQTHDISSIPALREGIYACLWQWLDPVPTDLLPPDDAGEDLRALVALPDPAAHTRAVAEILRRGRDGSAIPCADGITLVDFIHDPAMGTTTAGLVGDPPAGVTILACDDLGGFEIWHPCNLGFPATARAPIASLLGQMAGVGMLPHGAALHIHAAPNADGTTTGRVFILPPTSLAAPEIIPAPTLAAVQEAVSAPDITGPQLRFHQHDLRPQEEARRALTERLNDRAFPLGYRINLTDLRDPFATEEDIERLRAEIDEREAQIALIQALGRGQLRLLRFTDAQLPALVDGLRRMPRVLRDHDALLYAATHAVGRGAPLHFIAYDPEKVQFDGVLPDVYWRAVSDDHPISYWLDPHAEIARETDAHAPRVYVPHGQHIIPELDSISGSLGGTLALLMGNLFAAGAVDIAGLTPEHAFVFTDLTALRDKGPAGAGSVSDTIGVELIDMRVFHPVHVAIRWINDHIVARSPQHADPEDLRDLAETLYQGQIARDLRGKTDSEREALRAGWDQTEADLLAQVDGLSTALAREVGALHEQLAEARAFVSHFTTRMGALDTALDHLTVKIADHDLALAGLADALPESAQARMALIANVAAAWAENEAVMAKATADIATLTDRLHTLRGGWR